MSHALGQTIATVEGGQGGEARRRSSRGGTRPSARSRGASMYDGDSDDDGSYYDDEHSCSHSQQRSSLYRPRRSRKSAHQKEADLTKYTEDPKEEDLPEGVARAVAYYETASCCTHGRASSHGVESVCSDHSVQPTR